MSDERAVVLRLAEDEADDLVSCVSQVMQMNESHGAPDPAVEALWHKIMRAITDAGQEAG